MNAMKGIIVRSLLIALFVYSIFVNVPAYSDAEPVAASAEETIKSAIRSWCPIVQKQYCNKTEFKIQAIKIFGNYARATVSRADGQGETETAYLKKEDGHWTVLDRGTGVDPSQLHIPRDAW